MDQKTALELYKLYRQENATWLSSHRGHNQQYFTLIMAILGFSLAALIQLMISIDQFSMVFAIMILVVIALGPVVNIILCHKAIEMSDSAYRMFLEVITIQAKLEAFLGINGANTTSSFPSDTNFLPERWLDGRNFLSTNDFIDKSIHIGSNGLIQKTYKIFIGANVTLILVGIAIVTVKFIGVTT